MATERQIAANRRNAKKSTGPVSREGRARSARNATRHGLNAAIAVDDTVIGLYRALLGEPEAEPPVAGGAAFEHASLDVARAQVRLQRALRQLAEADAKVSELVATNGFAGTRLARAWAALMADAGITAAHVVEVKIVALLDEVKPGEHNRRTARKLEALFEELELVPDGPPTMTQVCQDPGLMRLLKDRYLYVFDPVHAAFKERALAWRYRAEAESWRRKALRRWLELCAETEAARARDLPNTPVLEV